MRKPRSLLHSRCSGLRYRCTKDWPVQLRWEFYTAHLERLRRWMRKRRCSTDVLENRDLRILKAVVHVSSLLSILHSCPKFVSRFSSIWMIYEDFREIKIDVQLRISKTSVQSKRFGVRGWCEMSEMLLILGGVGHWLDFWSFPSHAGRTPGWITICATDRVRLPSIHDSGREDK